MGRAVVLPKLPDIGWRVRCFRPGGEGDLKHQRDLVNARAFRRILHRSGIGDQEIFDDPRSVSAAGAARLGDFDKASTRPSTALASVAPQEKATSASIPCSAR